ncbi:response regulator [Clostridium perfringens]|uniref:response regulator n=1 Tax=Clostridium perfringens TaxID=1502 RepID=UPI001ABA4B84|nr:response regulator transcription factor [Clostridium perfringens]MBO3360978.1 response regulator transcription factor [Clostridium perfringens]
MKPAILVIEDEKAIRNFVTATLEINSYKYHTAFNGSQGMILAISKRPDIIILDLGLPDMDGIEIIKKVREWSNCPIIVVSARSEDRDKIEALDLGADDYLTKPFSVDELMARIRVAIRKMNYDRNNTQEIQEFVNGDLKIDYTSGCVFLNEEEIHLTPIEYKLLCLLSKNVGRVLTHNYILKEIWSSTCESDIPLLRVFMATLRKKLSKKAVDTNYIQTHIGVGYRLLRIQDKDSEL